MSIGKTFIEVRVGFLIVLTSDSASASNEYYRRFGAYYGVDRLPPFAPPEEEIRDTLGIPRVVDDDLRRILDEWFDLTDSGSPFIRDQRLASRLLDSFRQRGYNLELLFCERVLADIAETPGPVAPTEIELAETYGFDVSWPSCNHSAILQPGLVPESAFWRSKLNKWGLLPDFITATILREEYLKVYPHPPFEIYHVHRVDA